MWLEDGEKYACEACIRGHRVSSCQHRERQLIHVAKKGRPVSQCPHCRNLRKHRAAHVKCECNDKSHAKEDCPHLPLLKELGLDENGNTTPDTCAGCCTHGAKCTCSLKKDPHLESVPEALAQCHKEAMQKLRAHNVSHHDSKPTVFTNGHHKPVHNFNDAHNRCGAPYRVPARSNSHHGHREIAQRSTDNLPLTSRPNVHHESPLHHVLNAGQTRSEQESPALRPTSNPSMTPGHIEIPALPTNAYSYSPFEARTPTESQPAPHFPDTIPQEWFISHDDAVNYGPPAVPELNYIDWSNYGFHGSPAMESTPNVRTIHGGLAISQMPSSYAASMERLNHPTSGFNSSGEISEVEDLPANLRPSNDRTNSNTSNDLRGTRATDDNVSHLLSTSTSYLGSPAGNMLAGDMRYLDIDEFMSEYAQNNEQPQKRYAVHPSQTRTPEVQQHQSFERVWKSSQQPTRQPTSPQSQRTESTPPESIRGYSITSNPSPSDSEDQHVPYSIREAQAQAHAESYRADSLDYQQKDQEVHSRMLSNADTFVDPMWGSPDVDQYGDSRGFRLDDEREDEQWAR